MTALHLAEDNWPQMTDLMGQPIFDAGTPDTERGQVLGGDSSIDLYLTDGGSWDEPNFVQFSYDPETRWGNAFVRDHAHRRVPGDFGLPGPTTNRASVTATASCSSSPRSASTR